MAPGAGADAGFTVFTREEWVAMGRERVRPDDDELVAVSVADGAVTPDEARDVYLPLARWIGTRLAAGADAGRSGSPTAVIGLTGSVAVGKTTTARVLTALLRGAPDHPAVELLTTDGFLYPNRVLARRGLLARKGFPETYDQEALDAAVRAVRGGRSISVPVYSHGSYDIVPGRVRHLGPVDLLVVEGLTVLQLGGGPDRDGEAAARSPVDVGIYLDADEQVVRRWHAERLSALRSAAEGGSSEFHRWVASLGDAEVEQLAATSWSEINLVNLRDHIAPTRSRADLVVDNDGDHRMRRILVRQGPAGLPEGAR